MRGYISSLDLAGLPGGGAFPRRTVVLGSTGSIGVNGLDVMAREPEKFQVLALAGARNVKVLAEQAATWRPPYLAVLTDDGREELTSLLPSGYAPEIFVGPEGYVALAGLPEADCVLAAQVGAAGLPPALAAAEAGKLLCLANKEALVLGGPLIRAACKRSGAVLLPVDSEHNALFQGLCGHGPRGLRRMILTASGGPFRGRTRAELAEIGVEEALRHPNWSMGAKISIDSATLMNKGLEVIEAAMLYGLGKDEIDVVVHPQSIVHSLVEYQDGSQLAHLGPPDMRIPIAYCLAYPERLPLPMEFLDLAKLGTLTFEHPDLTAFPCLGHALNALSVGGGAPGAINAANEVAVEAFLNREIAFLDIPALVGEALNAYAAGPTPDLSDLESVLTLDRNVREATHATVRTRR